MSPWRSPGLSTFLWLYFQINTSISNLLVFWFPGRNTSNTCSTPTPVANHDTPYRPPSSLRNQKTYPKSALKHSSIPKMEPFPVSPPTITLQNVDIPVPMAPTKLNDVYASPKSPRLPLVCGPNFNVAPRGWGEMKEYYRPVALDGVGNTSLPYTDY